MLKQTDTFEAVGSDSETYTVFVFTNYIDVGTQTDPHAVIQGGPKELRTSDGLSVTWVSKGKYTIVPTGVTLRSDSPDAP